MDAKVRIGIAALLQGFAVYTALGIFGVGDNDVGNWLSTIGTIDPELGADLSKVLLVALIFFSTALWTSGYFRIKHQN